MSPDPARPEILAGFSMGVPPSVPIDTLLGLQTIPWKQNCFYSIYV